MIVKVGNRYIVRSKGGKNLSQPMSKGEAEKRLAQVEYFKHKSK